MVWGAVVGTGQAASPLVAWWLPPSAVYALGLAVIVSAYIGFAVADGRIRVLLVEIGVAAAFVVVAATAITGSRDHGITGSRDHGISMDHSRLADRARTERPVATSHAVRT
ncbi:hypothetical protein H4V95_002243 [Arthrobacter sp. CAN_C5]|nr:hypothetical protein [Arthrobacter sp. CAN_C5]